MAYVPRYVDKGICTCCNGSGWAEVFNKQTPTSKIKRDKPTQFDLDKCSVCGGSGRRIELE